MLLSESPRLASPAIPASAKGHPTHRHEADISHDCFPFEKFSRLLIIRLQVCLFKGQHAASSRMVGKKRNGDRGEEERREKKRRGWERAGVSNEDG